MSLNLWSMRLKEAAYLKPTKIYTVCVNGLLTALSLRNGKIWIAIAIPLNECLDGRETVLVFIISAAASVEFSLTATKD